MSKKTSIKKIAIIASQFNEFITRRLLNACLEEFSRQGISQSKLKVVWVPGSFEIPVVALRLARRKDVDGVICLGAVIRGETFHFELVARAVAEGIAQVSMITEKPVIFAILTTDTVNQAYKRSQGKGDNKGRDAAKTVLQMIQTMSELKKG